LIGKSGGAGSLAPEVEWEVMEIVVTRFIYLLFKERFGLTGTRCNS